MKMKTVFLLARKTLFCRGMIRSIVLFARMGLLVAKSHNFFSKTVSVVCGMFADVTTSGSAVSSSDSGLFHGR